MSIDHCGVRTAFRIAGITTGACIFTLVSATAAFAHVTAHAPEPAVKGSYAKIIFRVPNEEDGPKTVKLEVDLPTSTPLASVYVEPIPGWTAEITKSPLPQPVKLAKQTVDQAVTKVVWTAAPGGGIGRDQFQEFGIAGGAIPDNTNQLVMPAIQTYDDGTVVRWDAPPAAPGAQEPEHPAPALSIASSANQPVTPQNFASGDGSTDSTARWLGGAGLVVGVFGLGTGGRALLRRRSGGSA